MTLSGKRIAVVATDGFEQSELVAPRDTLREAGAEVVVVAPQQGTIKGWDGDDWGQDVPVDAVLDDVKAEDFDALVLPGGQINPDVLRLNEQAITLIREFAEAGKPIAAICHAPWLLITAALVRGRKVTSYPSIKVDLLNAGAEWSDSQVVVDDGLITSRNPGDLEAFNQAIIETVSGGKSNFHQAA